MLPQPTFSVVAVWVGEEVVFGVAPMSLVVVDDVIWNVVDGVAAFPASLSGVSVELAFASATVASVSEAVEALGSRAVREDADVACPLSDELETTEFSGFVVDANLPSALDTVDIAAGLIARASVPSMVALSRVLLASE